MAVLPSLCLLLLVRVGGGSRAASPLRVALAFSGKLGSMRGKSANGKPVGGSHPFDAFNVSAACWKHMVFDEGDWGIQTVNEGATKVTIFAHSWDVMVGGC